MSRAVLAMLSAGVVALAGCSGDDGDVEGPDSLDGETVGSTESALLTDAWEGVYAARATGATFDVNPLGEGTVRCLDGVYRTSCNVHAVSLAKTGLSASQQTTIMQRIATEPAQETGISVIVKGAFVRVRDHRGGATVIRDELRVSTVYLSPTRRTHAAKTVYVSSFDDPDYSLISANVETLVTPGHTISVPFLGTIVWTGPSTQRPTGRYTGKFVSVTSFRELSPGLPPVLELSVDQQFRRQIP